MVQKRVALQIFFSAICVLAVAALCFPFADSIGHRSVALILLLTVSVLAMRQGLAAVLTAAVLSALVWDFFFIPPRFTFHIESAEDVLFMVMYFIVALLNGIINYRLRQLEQLRSEKHERESALKLYGTLFSSLSHDLRTPIAAVLGAADTLRENYVQLTDNQRNKLLDEIAIGTLRLSGQVENLLNMSRIEAGMIHAKKAWCDLGDLIHGVLKKNMPSPPTHRVDIRLPENFPLVQLDFGLTEQILQNLLVNALRHTPPGTEVRISATILRDPHGHFEANPDDDELQTVREATTQRLLLEVSDNGPGFPPAEIERVFDKFYRSGSTKADGTGLGLFVAEGFAEAQGGDITLRNLPTGGACFVVEIPTTALPQTIRHD
jgi:two-component system sensor histidine kinase KdpD